MTSSKQLYSVLSLSLFVALCLLVFLNLQNGTIYSDVVYTHWFGNTTLTIRIPTYASVAEHVAIAEPSFHSSGQGSMGYTDSSKSTFHLKDASKDIHVGEFFSVIIEARDKNERHRVIGGDFWYTSIQIGKYCYEAGKVIDLRNGTYEVVFFAACPGLVELSIILVHTVETVYFYKHTIWPMEERKLWNATYKLGDIEEYGLCRIHGVGTWSQKCEFPNPRALGSSLMLCDPPPTLPCSSFYGLMSKGNAREILADKYMSLLTKHEDLFSREINFGKLKNGTQHFNIVKSDREYLNDYTSLMDIIDRPACMADIPEPLSDGFWYRKRWNSFACKSRTWSQRMIRSCVADKILIFMGDSTTRQWCEKLIEYLGIRLPDTIPHYTFKLNHDILNLTFQFHPYVLGNGLEREGDGIFEVDFLASLPTDRCQYVIMISPWAHYEVWTKQSYVSRLEHIKAGIITFRKRCPATKFIIKSAHPRRHSSKTLQTYKIARLTSDVLLYEFRRLMHDTFSGMGVHFIDIWDMNLAYNSPNTIHMPLQVALQELFMYFSHICPDQ